MMSARLKIKLSVLSLVIILFPLVSCSPKRPAESKRPLVVVSILPYSWFLERIGGDKIDKLVLVGPGQNPHSYEPTPRQMSDLSRAEAWILSGTNFEKSLKKKVSDLYPSLRLVDGTGGVRFRSLDAHNHTDEVDPESEDDHQDEESGMDPHTWLGWEPAKILSGHIRDTLIEIDPANTDFYEVNYQKVLMDIDREYEELEKSLAPLRGRSVFVFHPAFGYFLDEFGIIQESVETGGKEPTPQALDALIKSAREDKVRVIFVQTQFPVSAAHTVADSLNAEVVPLDPLAADWLTNIRMMGDALKKSVDK